MVVSTWFDCAGATAGTTKRARATRPARALIMPQTITQFRQVARACSEHAPSSFVAAAGVGVEVPGMLGHRTLEIELGVDVVRDRLEQGIRRCHGPDAEGAVLPGRRLLALDRL